MHKQEDKYRDPHPPFPLRSLDGRNVGDCSMAFDAGGLKDWNSCFLLEVQW